MSSPRTPPSSSLRPAPPARRRAGAYGAAAVERAVRLFKALGDGQRLRLLECLTHGEASVGELAEATGEPLAAISQRLRLLKAEGLVRGRREGKHVFYSLDDDHVAALLASALEHASEPRRKKH